MSAALLAFLGALLAGVGARDQMLVAGLAARRFLPLTLLVLAVFTSVLAAAAVAKAAEGMAPLLSADSRVLFAGIAAAIAGLECIAIGPPRVPEEPTRSLFAHLVVLLVHQLTDGARFLIFAIAVAKAVPTAAALGGAAGGAATVLIGAMAGGALHGRRLRVARRLIGAVLLLVGAWLVLQVLH
jgi:hypothetical protein